MSFGSGGFGGFGSNNNNTGSTFGGFGSNNNNTSSGFGSNTNTGGSIFGGANNNNTAGGGMFGANTNTSTSSPFGGGGAFGTNNTTTTSFGSTPFGGGSTGGGMFGGNSASTNAFGGFGANKTTSTPAFGGGSTGTGIFGQNKSAGFGTNNTTTGGNTLFGGGNTTGGFGTNNTTSAFGSTSNTPFGGANNNTNNGTAGAPFQPFTEKDPGSANSSAQYQTITFQQPYSNYSLEELRVVDYAQGRRYGNQNGQGGAFGQSTGFGGFGTNNNNNTTTSFGGNTNTGTGMFGGNNNTTSAFGSNTGSAFGGGNNNTGSSLFGQNKPAGGIFGGGNTTTTQAGTTGGLFGGATNTNSNPFGSSTTNNAFGGSTTNTGNSLFGGQNTTQSKPAFGGFGTNTNTTTANSNPFGGATANTGTSIFGQNQSSGGSAFGGANQASTNTGNSLFGNNNAATNNTGGLFGQNQTQNQSTGGIFGGGLGQNNQNQQKPSLFGNSTTTGTGTSLFGQSQQQQPQPQTGGLGLFGQKPATGGVFGNSTAQPSTGLFNNSTTNTANTGGSLFGGGLGAQNNQQNTGLFGASNNQPKTSLFGSSTTNNTNTGNGLFGGLGQSTNNAAPLGNSLFGNQSQQQPTQQPMNNSLFGASGNSLLNTSMQTNPYGNDPLFAGLSTPLQSPGPLATPLSSSQKNKKSAILPQHKLNPSHSTRLLTPQKRAGGYGFTYSTYGTPASGQSSPLGGSLFGNGTLSRHLGKSLSSSNLRNSMSAETSVLAPGAFSMTARPYGTGSLKKLNLNRNIHAKPSSLFDEPAPKRVSFAATPNQGLPNGSTTNSPPSTGSSASTALVVRPEEPNTSSPTVNGTGNHSTPQMQQVNGTGSTPISGNQTQQTRTSASLNVQNGQYVDPTPGGYWSEPPLDVLQRMSPGELKSVSNFVVGRDKVGKIEFNHSKPVDLSNTPLDRLFGDIVCLNHRNATVYGDSCTVPKPRQGSGLNHPSRITMGNSWPRGAARGANKLVMKHVERLKRVEGTEFERYDANTGEWIFRVPHFSSYGFEYDQPEDLFSSELSPVPETPARFGSSQMTVTASTPADSIHSATGSSPDDTFDFKRGTSKFRRSIVPGQFSDGVDYEEEDEMEETEMEETQGESFLGGRSVGSLDGQHEYTEVSGSESVDDQDMADSVSGPIRTTEQDIAGQSPFKDSVKPKSILKASQLFRPAQGTPTKGPTVFDDDWANTLQRTISPRKQDRQALRENQGDALRERGNITSLAQSLGVRHAKSTMDRMDLYESLFGGSPAKKAPTAKRVAQGIQYPYAKRPKTDNDLNQLSGTEKDFHSCSKPHFSETGVLVYTGMVGASTGSEDSYYCDLPPIVGSHKDIRFKKLPTFPDAVPPTIEFQMQHSQIRDQDSVPKAAITTLSEPYDFCDLAEAVPPHTAAGYQEKQAWQLLSLLFDDLDFVPDYVNKNGDGEKQWRDQHRKEQLSLFWKELVFDDAQNHAREAATAEEKALAYLSCNSIDDAISTLFHASDLRLATMVSQIGGDEELREDMKTQIEEWRKMDLLSEMDDAIRALYELISGECNKAEGKVGVGRENKASTFKIGTRFNLDWRRAFGLRLWYQSMTEEPIEMAVAQFADALSDGKEDVKPVPWFIERGLDMGWDDPEKEDREDVLWGILKLYASMRMSVPTNIEDVLAPENVSGHPLNTRLSFQLFHAFYSRYVDGDEDPDRAIDMPTYRDSIGGSNLFSSTTSRNDLEQAEDAAEEVGDKLTLTYAASLHTPEHWTTAVWVYLHLSHASMREHYIRSLLTQFSNTFEIAQGDPTYEALRKMTIDTEWMHAAAAARAKSEGNALRQATHTIKANDLQEAHEVLCRSVGPEAIISRHLDPLRDLLAGFEDKDRSPEEAVPGWVQGGQIYADYIHLVDLTEQRNPYRPDERLDNDIHALLRKLQRSLEKVAIERWDGVSLEERVALSEIAGTVANLMAKNKLTDRASVLKLPLTEDLWLRHSVDLSASYYRNVVR